MKQLQENLIRRICFSKYNKEPSCTYDMGKYIIFFLIIYKIIILLLLVKQIVRLVHGVFAYQYFVKASIPIPDTISNMTYMSDTSYSFDIS